MKRYVISIGRQLGSGGKDIAEKLGEMLGISVYDKKLLEVAAQESGIDTSAFENADEQESDSFLSNIVALRHAVTGYFGGQDSYMHSDRLFELQSEAMRSIAQRESCITIGRCSEYVLRDHPCLISIFITADSDDRIKRIMRKDGLSEEQAKEKMERGDKRRRSYHDYYATTHWGEAHSYDLCINSSLMGIEGTVELLYSLIKNRFGL